LSIPLLRQARLDFHATIVKNVLRSAAGVPSFADKDSATSVALSKGIVQRLERELSEEIIHAQGRGTEFEHAVRDFLADSFELFRHLRPGDWVVRSGGKISAFEQYAHLAHVLKHAKEDPELGAALGNDYLVKPDVVVIRQLIADEQINADAELIDDTVAQRASLRDKVSKEPLLHASVSCKWTFRSDRAQNARAEALNLIRTRKGRVPHIVTVTAEPLPSRLASLALGTGDIDCLYHFALPELIGAAEEHVANKPAAEETLSMLMMMVKGKRLKDISDLPLDLAI
jgi:hypothetical protein